MTILPNSPEFVAAADGTWQQHMKWAIRDAADLAQHLDLPLQSVCPDQSSGPFPLFVPLPYLKRIEPGNPDDPLLRQVLPSFEENAGVSGSTDPVSESEFVRTPGLLQKYQGRALLVVNGTCAIHCRYCFRRHFPYNDAAAGSNWRVAVEEIANDPTVHEVILSGGDPLTVVDEQLDLLFKALEKISHVSRVRIHTRLPIVIPQRITTRLVQIMAHSRLSFIVVVHCNHAREIDESVEKSVRKLLSATNAVLNQAVLLKRINDSVEVQVALGERLIEVGIVPYYLHQFDEVRGAMHFKVPVEEGVRIIREMRTRSSGYMVPRFVKENPGQPNKTILI